MSIEQNIGLQALASTIGNEQWMRANVSQLRSIFNEEWTKLDQQGLLHLMFQLKLKGVMWTHESQIPKLMEFFARVKIAEQKTMPGNTIWVRRAPLANAPPPPPAPPPPTPHQQSVQAFMDRLAKNRKDG